MSPLRLLLQELLGDDGVLLFPSHATPAPFHSQPLFRPFNFAYTNAVINVLLLPTTQCPLGLGSEGNVPLGIQVRFEGKGWKRTFNAIVNKSVLIRRSPTSHSAK